MTERVTIGGLSVLAAKPRSETGAPLLFVHGYFGLGVAFERMMGWFAGRGHLCYAPDLSGHGTSPSPRPLGQLSIHDYVDDVARVARTMDRPVIVGHSMGGLIAQIAATRQLARAIVLLAPAPPRGIPVMSLRLAIAQSRYMPSILLSRPVRPGRSDLGQLVVNRVPERERDAVLDMFVPDSGRAGREMSLLGVPVDRADVRVPVFVIGGDQDRFIPPARTRRIAERYGTSVRVAIGRGHMLIIEPGYEEICEWIESWLMSFATVPASAAAAR